MAAITSAVQSPGHFEQCGAELPLIRVVVVDDSPDVADVIQLFLRYTGRVENVGKADNGRMAVELVDSLRPALVVMDVNMPVMNGLLATAAIKSLLPETKVLIVSADDDPEMALAAFDCGADGFMPKSNLQMVGYHITRLFPQ
jgi:DNA-binding NarL/FixJ family response regulator